MKAYLLITILMHVNFVCASAGSAAAASASASSSSGTSSGSAAASPVSMLTADSLGLQYVKILFSGDNKRLAAFGARRLPVEIKNEVYIYSIDQTTGTLIPAVRSPWKTQIDLLIAALSLSFDGNVIAICGSSSSNRYEKKFEIYWVDSGESALGNVCFIRDPQNALLSPNGQWLLIFGTSAVRPTRAGVAKVSQEWVEMYKINKEKKTIECVGPLLLWNNVSLGSIRDWKFSPNGAMLFRSMHDSSDLFIYDFNNRTGQISKPDGNVLSSLRPEKEYEEARKALVKPTPQLLNENCALVLEEYIVGSKPAKKEEKDSKEELDEMQQKMQKTQEQEKSRDQDASQLFAAIKQGDVKIAEKYLTPFTINATDSNRDTPLIQAVRLVNEPMVRAILNYQGEIVREDKKPAIVKADLKRLDKEGNAALWLAVSLNADYKIALLIAEKMTPQERAMNVRGAPVIVLLLEQAESAKAAKNKADYDKLVKLLRE